MKIFDLKSTHSIFWFDPETPDLRFNCPTRCCDWMTDDMTFEESSYVKGALRKIHDGVYDHDPANVTLSLKFVWGEVLVLEIVCLSAAKSEAWGARMKEAGTWEWLSVVANCLYMTGTGILKEVHVIAKHEEYDFEAWICRNTLNLFYDIHPATLQDFRQRWLFKYLEDTVIEEDEFMFWGGLEYAYTHGKGGNTPMGMAIQYMIRRRSHGVEEELEGEHEVGQNGGNGIGGEGDYADGGMDWE